MGNVVYIILVSIGNTFTNFMKSADEELKKSVAFMINYQIFIQHKIDYILTAS